MNMIRSISIIAVVAIAVSAFSAYAQDDPRLSGAAQMAAKRAKQGITPHVDKTHKGSLFGSHSYFRGVIPDDVYQLDDVGVRCNESGALDERSQPRCRRFHSDSKNTTFVVRLAPDKHLTFYYENASGKQTLVPYTVYDNNTYQMSYVSSKAQQFASAHGLGTGVAVASTSAPKVAAEGLQYCASLPPAARIKCDQEARSQQSHPKVEVAAAGSKCDKVPELLKGTCERMQQLSDQNASVKVGPVIGSIIDAAKK